MISDEYDNFVALGDLNPFPQVSNALFIGGHPDDPDNLASGLTLRLIEWGVSVHYLIVSDGEKGATGFPADNIREIRRLEQQAAATVLGVSSVEFLGYCDGNVFDSFELREKITREIRKTKSTLIVTHDPLSRRYREHPDHRATGAASLAAAFPSARLKDYFPEQIAEGLPTVVVEHAMLFSSDQSNTWIELNESHVAKKRLAIDSHISQAISINKGIAIDDKSAESKGSEFAHASRFTYVSLK